MSEKKHHDLLKCLGDRIDVLEIERDEFRERAEKAEARVVGVVVVREQQARELKRLQDENAEWREELQHERNRSAALELERKNTPTAGVADRIVTSPEFRELMYVSTHYISTPPMIHGAGAALLSLLDREVKR